MSEPAVTLDERPAGTVTDATIDEPFHVPFLWTIAGLAAAVLWIRPLASSLWTDELGTWWVISGSARDTVTRAEAVQGQSPFYYLIAWAARHVVGPSEIGFRLPSLLFCVIAAFLVFRIAKRLVDVETARIAVIAFVVWPPIAFAASDARPYALATLMAVASTWAVIAWLDRARIQWALAYVVLAAGTSVVHPLFGLVVIPQVVYAVVRIRERSTHARPRDVVLSVIGIAVLTIPIGLEVLSLWRRQQDWSIPGNVTVAWMVLILIPPALIGAAIIGGLLAGRSLRLEPSAAAMERSGAVLLLGWFLVPVAVLLLLALVSSIKLLEGRYLLMAAPAAVILAAIAIRSVEPARARRIVLLVFVILSILDLASPVKSGDFRAAADAVRSAADDRSVVLVRSGFQESVQPDWYTDPTRRGLLTAATDYYPVPGTVVPLPANLDPTTLDLARAQVDHAMTTADQIVVVTLSGSPYGPWLDQYMADRGWEGESVGEVNLFTITIFERSAP
jgi:Dolichyl-phosphate-mannose-protein mannosyltransferase